MRLLLVSLLLSLALVAGEASPLAASVARFGDDRADVREAASLAAAQHVRRELAPLLEALRAGDPEVRRRARAILESLLPSQPEPEEPPVEGPGQFIIVRGGGGNIQIRGRAIQILGGVAGVDQEDVEQLRQFGVQGHWARDETLRRQLQLADGRGFAVQTVDEESVAHRIGLRAHDIVLRVSGKPVMRIAEFVAALGPEGDWPHARLTVLRDGEVLNLPQR